MNGVLRDASVTLWHAAAQSCAHARGGMRSAWLQGVYTISKCMHGSGLAALGTKQEWPPCRGSRGGSDDDDDEADADERCATMIGLVGGVWVGTARGLGSAVGTGQDVELLCCCSVDRQKDDASLCTQYVALGALGMRCPAPCGATPHKASKVQGYGVQGSPPCTSVGTRRECFN